MKTLTADEMLAEIAAAGITLGPDSEAAIRKSAKCWNELTLVTIPLPDGRRYRVCVICGDDWHVDRAGEVTPSILSVSQDEDEDPMRWPSPSLYDDDNPYTTGQIQPAPWDIEPGKWVADLLPVVEWWEKYPDLVCSIEGCGERRYQEDPYPTGDTIFDETTGVNEPVMSGRLYRSKFCPMHHDQDIARQAAEAKARRDA